MLKVEMKVPKKLSRDGGVFLPKNLGAMKSIASYAVKAIRKRMQTTQTDGTGAKLPRLVNKGWFWTSVNDRRFKGLTRVSFPEIMGRQAKGKSVMLVDFDGYGAQKRKMGAKNRKDGTLTGDMWAGLSATLKKQKGGWAIQLHFKGGTHTGKVAGWGTRTVKKFEGGKVVIKKTKVPKMKTVTVRNRDKAKMLQYRDTRAVVALLSMTPEEKKIIRDLYMKKIKVFGKKMG